MEILKTYFPNIFDIFSLSYDLFLKGGWVFFVWGVVYMLYKAYREETEHQFVLGIEWVFLEIIPPKENLVSTLAVESIFSQMHTLHRSLTFMEVYIEGQFQQWYSLEIVSFGGKVSFILRVPKRYQHLVESAFYSQYPGAEIRETSDYMEKFQYDPYNPNEKNEIFGVEFKLLEDSVLPIKTYKDFEHTSAEEKIVDPLSNLFLTLERLEPWEFIGMQLLIQPIQNAEFKHKSFNKIKELIGEEMPHKFSFFGLLMTPVNWFASLSSEALFGGGHGGHGTNDNKPKNNWLNMTEGEKERVKMIENKMSKPNYQSKLRLLYLTPKEKYDKIRRFEVIGAYRHFSTALFNTMKVDNRTWTKVDPLVSPGLEKPYLEYVTKKRKYWMVRGYKNRSMYVGSGKFLLSTEEIATLFHFPISSQAVPAGVQSSLTKKVQAPADLPVLE